MSFGVKVGPGAMADIQRISRWWRKNRQLAPCLFDEELDILIGLLELHPYLGTIRRLRAHGEVLAIVLRRTKYLVLYQVDPEHNEIWIVRVRQGNRRPLAKK